MKKVWWKANSRKWGLINVMHRWQIKIGLSLYIKSMYVARMGYYVYFALILLDGWIIKSSDSSGSELNRERYNSHNWIRMTRLAGNLGSLVDGPPTSMPSKFVNKIKLFCCFWELWNFTISSDLSPPPHLTHPIERMNA